VVVVELCKPVTGTVGPICYRERETTLRKSGMMLEDIIWKKELPEDTLPCMFIKLDQVLLPVCTLDGVVDRRSILFSWT